MSEHTGGVRAITWFNGPYWLGRTLAEDRLTYRRKNRRSPVSPWWRRWATDPCRPVFLLGAPRSGTTFLGACLAAFPEVSYHHEPVGTKAAARYVYEGAWEFEEARRFYRRIYRWLLRIHLDGGLRFAEKTPRNCFIVPFLCRAFPDAQFIHIIRDGRDAALSLTKRPWLQAAFAGSGRRDPAGYPYGPYAEFWVEPRRREEFEATSDLHRSIWAWRRYTESALAGASELPTRQYHELRYEDLVTDPVREGDRLLAYLRITAPESRRLFQQAAAGATRRSVGRWRHELAKDEVKQIEAEAGALLRQLGYLGQDNR